MFLSCFPRFLFSDEEEDGVDSEADQATDEGSIQANELEI